MGRFFNECEGGRTRPLSDLWDRSPGWLLEGLLGFVRLTGVLRSFAAA